MEGTRYLYDCYKDERRPYKRTRTPKQVTEGVYEGAIDVYYGRGENIPPEMKAKYGYKYGFIAQNEYGTYDVYGFKDGRYYWFEADEEDIPFEEEEEEDTGPASRDGKDVMEWLYKHFAEDSNDRRLIELGRNPEIMDYMASLYDLIHDMDRNAAGPYDWLDSSVYKYTLMDAVGLVNDEGLDEFLDVHKENGDWVPQQERLIRWRWSLKERYGGIQSKDRKSKWMPVFNMRKYGSKKDSSSANKSCKDKGFTPFFKRN